ncbi:LysE/ArgO family amino acid transporter [Alteromonas sp. BMJM2]|uniref:LysE/ArgO family amino acid transporter n=1 Tax=Alteromonas sp. BMJM2 TaxID=2954241 RepID=UPI0022B2D162|nr:LysE family transporter [Alteromonas sp. BMJM2]
MYFLACLSCLAAKSAFTTDHALQAQGKEVRNLLAATMICLAFTWLNPHVYLDTFVLLGSISTQHEGQQVAFGLSVILGCFVFFFSLRYGAKLLILVFKNPKAWKVHEFIIGIVMLALGVSFLV